MTAVVILVTDSNDNAPVFTDGPYTVRVMEGPGALDSPILTVTATDRDMKNNSILTFTFDKEYPEFEIVTTQDQTPAQVSPQPQYLKQKCCKNIYMSRLRAAGR